MLTGVFVSFEGTEGCGKSTQIGLLAEAMTADGREVVRVREPGGTVLGEEVRNLLKHSPAGEGMCAEAEILLFAASRAQLTRSVITPALARGAVVLADRFLDSTTVYQGIARGLPEDAVAAINRFAIAGQLPHLTIILDLTVAESRARMAGRGDKFDRIEREDDAFFERVRDGYLAVAAANPQRCVVIPACAEPAEIHRRILAELHTHSHGIVA